MRKHVNIGQCYRDCTATWIQWQVERVYQDFLGLPHAVVSSLTDDMEQRTIACPTLLDRRRFELVSGESDVTPLPAATEMGAGFVVLHN